MRFTFLTRRLVEAIVICRLKSQLLSFYAHYTGDLCKCRHKLSFSWPIPPAPLCTDTLGSSSELHSLFHVSKKQTFCTAALPNLCQGSLAWRGSSFSITNKLDSFPYFFLFFVNFLGKISVKFHVFCLLIGNLKKWPSPQSSPLLILFQREKLIAQLILITRHMYQAVGVFTGSLLCLGPTFQNKIKTTSS